MARARIRADVYVHRRVAVCVRVCIASSSPVPRLSSFESRYVRREKMARQMGGKMFGGMLVFAITGKRDKSRERERIGRISLIFRQRSSFIRLRASSALSALRALFEIC